MSWTAPTTRATGDLITAAIWNTDVVNNLVFLHDRIPVQAIDGTTALKIQAGSTTLAVDGSGLCNIGYPSSFPNSVITVMVENGSASTGDWDATVNSLSGLTGFQAQAFGRASVTLQFNWIAIGT